MGLKINSNIASLSALRHLGMTESKMLTSTTRLSTGLRINSAGEDPAGMVISEGMRSQISGLNQAARNAQDAINMSKTAEGALDEVQRLLRDLRGLAVHSANTGAVDANQVSANQQAYRNAVDSINRIAEHTSWGTKKLLDGTAGASVGLTRQDLVRSLHAGNTIGGNIVRSGDVQITPVTQPTQTTTGSLATTYADGNATVPAGIVVVNGVTIRTETGETLSGLVAKMNERSSQTGVTAEITGTGPVAVRLTATSYGANFSINYSESGAILNGGASATGTLGQNAVYTVTTNVEPSGTANETFTGGQGPGVDGLTLTSAAGGRLNLSHAATTLTGTTTIGTMQVGTMRFQIGANSDQMTSFLMPSLATDQLGTSAYPGKSLATVDMTSQTGATEAIDIIDSAIQQLAMLRGDLGSFQANFLESTMRSLAVAEENMTASESSIRDADIAREMTEFTKVQILRQSGMSVLAQANSSSRDVLQLLQQ